MKISWQIAKSLSCSRPSFKWLDEHGGFCDCEILANVEQHVSDALMDAKH